MINGLNKLYSFNIVAIFGITLVGVALQMKCVIETKLI